MAALLVCILRTAVRHTSSNALVLPVNKKGMLLPSLFTIPDEFIQAGLDEESESVLGHEVHVRQESPKLAEPIHLVGSLHKPDGSDMEWRASWNRLQRP